MAIVMGADAPVPERIMVGEVAFVGVVQVPPAATVLSDSHSSKYGPLVAPPE